MSGMEKPAGGQARAPARSQTGKISGHSPGHLPGHSPAGSPADSPADSPGRADFRQKGPSGQTDMRQLTHDLNNYLTILMIHFEQLQSELVARPDLQKRIDLLADHLKSVVSIGLELQEPVAHPPPVILFAPRDFSRLVHDQLTMLRLLAGEGVALRLLPLAEMPTGSVSVIPDYFKRALIQLIRNSVEALLEQPDSNQAPAADSPQITLWMTCQPDQFILHIQDNGPGIAEPVRASLFEPGISTRAGRLRGHGLPAVRRLASFWQGAVSSEPASCGAHFCLSFPFQKSS